MATPPITQADVEQVTGVTRLAQLSNDVPTPGGTADTAIVDYWMQIATDRAVGILMVAGWTVEQIEVLFTSDTTVKNAIAMLAASFIGSRKDDFKDQLGSYPYAPQGKLALELLNAKAKGTERSNAEQESDAGRHPRTRSHNVPQSPRALTFGRGRNNTDPDDPGPGGF
jgi:hypothetical protein